MKQCVLMKKSFLLQIFQPYFVEKNFVFLFNQYREKSYVLMSHTHFGHQFLFKTRGVTENQLLKHNIFLTV